jgi:hypothetical protein
VHERKECQFPQVTSFRRIVRELGPLHRADSSAISILRSNEEISNRHNSG